MTTEATQTAPAPAAMGEVYVTLPELAKRWRVSLPTARNRTRAEDFPAPLTFGPRSSRWLADEVLAWEQTERSTRRVVTGSLPQHYAHRAAGVVTTTRIVKARARKQVEQPAAA